MPILLFQCEKMFSSQSSLNHHNREVHGNVKPVVIEHEENMQSYKCLEGCRVSFKGRNYLRHHLNNEHEFSSKEEKIKFETF